MQCFFILCSLAALVRGVQFKESNGPLFLVDVAFKLSEVDPDEGATITFDPQTHNLKMVKKMDPSKGTAWGYVRDTLDKTGWIEVHIQTTDSTQISNDAKMYSAGFLEGALTAARMSQFYSNFYQMLIKDEENMQAINNIKHVFHDELEFVEKNANFHHGVMSLEPIDPYWKHARYILMQLWGMKDGYNFAALQNGVHMISMIDMLMINSHAEMGELMLAYTPKMVARRREAQSVVPGAEVSLMQKRKLRGDSMVHNHTFDRDWENLLTRKGHCSAFVRLGVENSDIFVGHTSWDDYSKMTKMFKYYDFSLPGSTAATKIAMSSYPGCVSSTDDWYMLSSGLIVADTTLEILNPRLYERIPEFPTNSHIPNFMHVMICNRMSKTAAQWTVLFSERNSGTNNAQWLVVDYNQFLPGETLPDSAFWVLEQIPSIVHKEDMSHWLRRNGFFASFNRPHFEQIREETGHTAAQQKFGPLFSWGSSPRAQIFERIAPNVNNLFSMRTAMQRNNFPNEGILPIEPGHAIAARMDLDPVSRLPNGGIDSKVINRCLFKNFQCQAISGPTHQAQKVFRWRDGDSDLFPGWPHLGLPNVWNFEWVQMTPSRQMDRVVDIKDC